MLRLQKTIIGTGVLSLQTGKPIATVTATIINPNNLKVEGFYCEDTYNKQSLILVEQDIRETLKDGFVVNNYEVLVEPEELIRLKQILEFNFELLGKHVETVTKEKVGKVSDYAVETDTMYVQKIYASQPIFKNLAGGSLSIDRSQINEITNRRIIINDLLKDSTIPLPAAIA